MREELMRKVKIGMAFSILGASLALGCSDNGYAKDVSCEAEVKNYDYDSSTDIPSVTTTPYVTVEPTATPKLSLNEQRKNAITYGTDEDNGESDLYDDDEEPLSTYAPIETSYYSYCDRMEWEKSNLHLNLFKYDEENGCVKAKGSKIPVRKVKYNKNKKSVTIRAEIGSNFRIKLTGVKKYKEVDGSNLKNRKYWNINDWRTVRETSSGKMRDTVYVSGAYCTRYAFRVNGKIFVVKVKGYASKKLKSNSYNEYRLKNSKYNYKTLLVTRRTSSSADLRNIKITDKIKNTYKYNSGYTKYCYWDKDNMYVQGCPVRLESYSVSRKATTSTRLLDCVLTDIAIDRYKIPSAEDMTREEACKWIRRNRKQLYDMFIEKDYEVSEYAGLAIYPIFKVANDFTLDEEYDSNGIIFYHAYDKKQSFKKYTWKNLDAIFSSAYDFKENDTMNSYPSYATIYGMIYNELEDLYYR